MTVDVTAVGRTSPWLDVSWTSDDALLYAVAVGAGQDDPCEELAFTTEVAAGSGQRVLPTFAAVLADKAGARPQVTDAAGSRRVHAYQHVAMAMPLSINGRARVRTRVAAIHDEGWGALIVHESEAVDATSGVRLFTTEYGTFVKDEGGVGERPSRPLPAVPDRRPDVLRTVSTRPEQALLYRLCGDRNPLHSDPAFARQCGFRRPILHGLCTYGIVGRVLLNAVANGCVERFASLTCRFTRRVFPGDALEIAAWQSADVWTFRATVSGVVVVDGGMFMTRAGEATLDLEHAAH
jgi:acyl dehydratase